MLTGIFLGFILGYFCNKYDDKVREAIGRWWKALESQLGINKD